MHDLHAAPPPPPPERRSFLKWLTGALGAIFGVVIGAPAIAYLIDPRHRAAAGSDFKTVARLSDLKKDVPQQAVILDVRRDAWTFHPSDVVGRVWLVRRDGDKVQAYSTVCPHLGCGINYEAKNKQFLCPCHGGTWDLECQVVQVPGRENPAPRGMDELETRRDPTNKDLVQVKYEVFMQGKHEKNPVT